MSDKPFNIQMILEGLGYKTHSYSGREMYGRECLAIHSDALTRDLFMMMKVSDLVRDRYEMPFIRGLDIRSDQLGKGHVIYFPDIPYYIPYTDNPGNVI